MCNQITDHLCIEQEIDPPKERETRTPIYRLLSQVQDYGDRLAYSSIVLIPERIRRASMSLNAYSLIPRVFR